MKGFASKSARRWVKRKIREEAEAAEAAAIKMQASPETETKRGGDMTDVDTTKKLKPANGESTIKRNTRNSSNAKLAMVELLR